MSTDNAHNVISITGTGAERENDTRTIEILDVDWFSGMLVRVVPVTSVNANKVVTDLEKVLGEKSKSPT